MSALLLAAAARLARGVSHCWHNSRGGGGRSWLSTSAQKDAAHYADFAAAPAAAPAAVRRVCDPSRCFRTQL